jgi:hypothetical protein
MSTPVESIAAEADCSALSKVKNIFVCDTIIGDYRNWIQ